LQASEDAKKLVDEERAFARAEIDNARSAVQRVEESLQEHERMSQASGKQVCVFQLSIFHVIKHVKLRISLCINYKFDGLAITCFLIHIVSCN